MGSNKTQSVLSFFIHSHNRSLLLVITLFLLIPPFIPLSQAHIEIMENQGPQRYIILFEETSVLETLLDNRYTQERSNLFSLNDSFAQMTELFSNVTRTQEEHKQSILSKMKDDPTFTLSSFLSWTINGCIIETKKPSRIEALKKLPGIKDIKVDEKQIVVQNNSIDSYQYQTAFNNQTSTIPLLTSTGKNITIAFFDTGVDYTHPALKDKFIGGYDFVDNDTDVFDDHGHGTHVTGIALGRSLDETLWTGGVAPDAQFYSYKVMDENGVGSVSAMLQAFDHAMDPDQDGDPSDHVHIISISAGDPNGRSDDLLSQAANNAVRAGICVIAAAGNKGPGYATISSPGIAEYVIAVGATTNNGQIASFSSRGSYTYERIKPDVIAPGVDVVSTWIDGGYHSLSGTSMATPYVAGICALYLAQYPEWSPLEVIMALRMQTTSLGLDRLTEGYGFLDVNTLGILPHSPPIAWIKQIRHSGYERIVVEGLIKGDNVSSYQCFITDVDSRNEWSMTYSISTEETQDDLCIVDTSGFIPGIYIVRLFVQSISIGSSDHFFINIEGMNQSTINVMYPMKVEESTHFSVSIHTSESRFICSVFLVPFKHPQIRFGSVQLFKAPFIHRESVNIEGSLYVFALGTGFPMITKKSITIYSVSNV